MKRFIVLFLMIAIAVLLSCDDGDNIEEVGTAQIILEYYFGDVYPWVTDITGDGDILVEYYETESGHHLWEYSSEDSEWRQIGESDTLWFNEARYSPDKSKICFNSDYKLYVMDRDGTNIYPVGDIAILSVYGWINDNEIYFLPWVDGRSLNKVDINTYEEELFVDLNGYIPSPMGGAGFFSLSPDGKSLVYSYIESTDVEAPVFWYTVIYDLGTNNFRRFDCELYGYSSQYSPDSGKIVHSTDDFTLNGTEIWIYDVDSASFSLFFRSYDLNVSVASDLWPGPFWADDGSAIISYRQDTDGYLRIYSITRD